MKPPALPHCKRCGGRMHLEPHFEPHFEGDELVCLSCGHVEYLNPHFPLDKPPRSHGAAHMGMWL